MKKLSFWLSGKTRKINIQQYEPSKISVIQQQHGDTENQNQKRADPTKPSDTRPNKMLPQIKQLFGLLALLTTATIGLIMAGIFLNDFASTNICIKYPEILRIVPLLLGLKGSIEMTYGSRLSTMAHGGLLVTLKDLREAALNNFPLIMCQSVGVTFLAAVLIIIQVILIDPLSTDMETVPSAADNLTEVPSVSDLWFTYKSIGSFRVAKFSLAALSTAFTAPVVLGSAITFLVYLSKKLGFGDPDNLVSPFVSATGDTIAVLTLSFFCTEVYTFNISENTCYFLCMTLILFAFYCAILSLRQESTANALLQGSVSIIVSMILGIIVGSLFQHSVETNPSASLYQLTLNGLGGNMAAIIASRTSSYIHNQTSDVKKSIRECWKIYFLPINLFRGNVQCMIMIFLFFAGLLIQFFVTIYYQIWHAEIAIHTITFNAYYVIGSGAQFFILFYASQILTYGLYAFDVDPDNNAIPLLTALGDLLGAILLCIAVVFVIPTPV